MSTSAGWGHEVQGGRGREEEWSPGQTGVERAGGSHDVGRSLERDREPTRAYGGGGGGPQRHVDPGRSLRARGGREMTRTGAHGFAGRGPMNYTRPDARIHEDVCDQLTEDDEIDASHIEVKVESCEVTLTGTVASRAMKRRAEELSEHVAGVKDVHNQIKVQPEREREPSRGRGGTANDGNGSGRNQPS